MCGIAGFYHTKGLKLDSSVLDKMVQSLHHRGPDAQGSLYFDHVGLSHARLSILDLTSAANQPMITEDERIILSYNGEVYNFKSIKKELETLGYTFITKGDTEVVLKGFQQWGTELFNKLNGFFAIAVFDKNKDELILARDRIGIKPLYYSFQNDTLLFGSELKTITSSGLFESKIDHKQVQHFVNYSYIAQDRTIFQDAFKLKPGHYLRISAAGIKLEKYWNLNEYALFVNENSLEKNIQITEDLINDSVGLRLQSDVPLGTFLSGGIDSSLVSVFASKNSQEQLSSFTIGFEEDAFDEAPFALQVSKKLNTNHFSSTLTEGHLLQLLDKIPRIFDEPFADSSAIPTYLVSQMAAKNITVALSGDGGDELFWGYNRYQVVSDILQKINKLPKSLQKPISILTKQLPKQKLKRLSHFLSRYSASQNLGDLYAWSMENFSSDELQNLLGENYETGDSMPNHIGLFFKDKLQDDRNLLPLIDMQSYLPDDILTKVDRTSMQNSLEVRVPLLDHRIVEHALSIPLNQKIHQNSPKYILKNILYKSLTKELFERPKSGFSVPLNKWLHYELKQQVTASLQFDQINKEGFFSPNYVQKQLDLFYQNKSGMTNKIWALFMFQKWLVNHLNES